ncbi:hypothetical protein [Deinococcus sp. Marseille-Q6407]|uniref:hypothetical protein n=1 Tax=Deinococcus sp. Marseille-Q6407 TaxID=2969223 RepID=UPI0021BEBE7C|nr:hypothetical protein [Deinococcus sp. Marseille-Q6407]
MNETATDKWRAEELTWEAIGSAMGVYGMLDLACQQLPRPHGEKHKTQNLHLNRRTKSAPRAEILEV